MPRHNLQQFRSSVSRLFQPGRRRLGLTFVAGLLWLLAWFDWCAWSLLPASVDTVIFLLGAGVAIYWLHRARALPDVPRRFIATTAFLPLWQATLVMASLLHLGGLVRALSIIGLAATFCLGLAWVVWLVERRTRATPGNRYRNALAFAGAPFHAASGLSERIWNPIDLDAWYYNRRHPRLGQSLGTFVAYTGAFFLVVLLLSRLSGCREIYEIPAGGGKPLELQQVVRIQKVIRKKFVINPYSAVIFNPPPIDDVKLQLLEVTKHEYKVGFGEGTVAGFDTGTARGKVRIIRLEYDGGDWDQDLPSNSDLNLLIEYGIRTGQSVHDRPESRRIAQLRKFPPTKSPPFVYLTGQRGIEVSVPDVDILRDYLLEKHGMLFADNGGSAGWHEQFFSLMRRVLPNVKPVPVPLDHAIHRVPYEIPFMPYVAPHGGRDAWGWVVDSRLVAYYHPGDIGDAWADGHAGVKRDIWEHSYQLGVNVIFYAHAQYHQWLDRTAK